MGTFETLMRRSAFNAEFVNRFRTFDFYNIDLINETFQRGVRCKDTHTYFNNE